MEGQEVYDRLAKALRTDPMRLDEELIELPQLQQEAGERAMHAISARDVAKSRVEIVEAEAADELRRTATEKISEAQITRDLPLDVEVQEAKRYYETCKLEADLWQVLANSIRTKQNSVKYIAELTIAGWLTPNNVKESRREQMHERRLLRRQ